MPKCSSLSPAYSDEQVDRGLFAVALCSGNTRRAAAALAEQGLPIPRSTLQKWVSRAHRERYMSCFDKVNPYIQARVAEKNEDLVERILAAEGEIAERLLAAVDDLKPSELAGALKNAAVAQGISQDKATLARGNPTFIGADTRSDSQRLADDVEKLRALGILRRDPNRSKLRRLR